MLFLLGSKEKSQKLQEQNSGSAKNFVLCSIISSFLFPVLKSSAPADEADQVMGFISNNYIFGNSQGLTCISNMKSKL